MDTNAIRLQVSEHPQGVVIRMIDGSECHIPHRDYIWFTPSFGSPESRSRMATSFWLHDAKSEETRLVNAMLVKELVPMKAGSNGHAKTRKGGKRR